jgi:tetratricopeptide (TPR) repeat protein
MRPALAIGILVCAVVASAVGQEHHNQGGGELGTVSFQTSCDKPLAAEFNRAVALLHSFEYDEARDSFATLAQKDPECAMAHWGIAMTYLHGLWGEIDVQKGQAAAANAKRIAGQNARTSARETAYIEAIAAAYEGDNVPFRERTGKFAAKMAELHASHPQDVEAKIFYALALDESAPRADKTYANERQCGELLEPLFDKLPNHPGVAHYLIHCYDNESLAPRGLDAARRYAKIAPASSHAQHMPSHIFVRLGLWQETVESNIAAMEAAGQDAAASKCQRLDDSMHAMHFLQFAYLQQGKLKQARSVVERSRKLSALASDCHESSEYVAASFALDAHDWELAAQLQPNDAARPRFEMLTWTAIGIGSARRGDLKRAEEAEATLAKTREQLLAKFPGGTHEGALIIRLEVAAWIAQAKKDWDSAIKTMAEVARLQDELGWEAWAQPPAREMLGDLLLEQKNAQAALEAYRTVLRSDPHLFNSLYGAMTAAKMAGDAKASAEYRARLKQLTAGGDRPEVARLND